MLVGIELIEGGAIVLALFQNGVPTQAGLGAFEDEEFKQHAIVVLGHSPFFVVIADGERVPRPTAANEIADFSVH